jgi:hypothetical protein
MVAHRNSVHAPLEELPGDRRRNSPTSGSILSIRDNNMGIVFILKPRQQPLYRVSAYIADDIAYKNDLHSTPLAFRLKKGKSGCMLPQPLFSLPCIP